MTSGRCPVVSRRSDSKGSTRGERERERERERESISAMINNRPTTVNGCCVGRPQDVKAWRPNAGGRTKDAGTRLAAV